MKRIEEIEQALKNSNVSPDAYAEWKDNSVTRRFLLEVEAQLLDTMSDASWAAHGTSCEQIALCSVKNAVAILELERVLEWIPREINTKE